MADDLTERVARAIEAEYTKAAIASGLFTAEDGSVWEEWTGEARAALAVVADDIDGIAGVLDSHAFIPGPGYDHNIGRCQCQPTHLHSMFGVVAHRRHLRDQLAAHIRGGA